MTHLDDNIALSLQRDSWFWDMVYRSGDCLVWKGPFEQDGYGRCDDAFDEIGTTRAHRVAFMLTHGQDRPESRIPQSCSNRLCVNPHHLYMTTSANRFWSKVAKGNGCWPWLGRRDKDGYGRFWVNGKHEGAHRFAYAIAVGNIPPGLVVRHTCDHRWCVRPDHLVVGTQKDNVRDMLERNRANRRKGSQHHKAKLDEEKVIRIRRLQQQGLLNVSQLAEEYGLSETSIRAAAKGETWAHLPVPAP